MPFDAKQIFIDTCTDKKIRILQDINGVLFGLATAEQMFDLFKVGMLTCTFCGHISENKLRHKYHMICYCEAFRKPD